MSETTPQDVARIKVVYAPESIETVSVRRDIAFARNQSVDLFMDLYEPPRETATRLPAVVIVAGYPDPGFQRTFGCHFKDMTSTSDWARLIAASGMTAITYTNVSPAAGLEALLEHLHRHAERLGFDERSMGLWACSGSVPLALSALMESRNQFLRCAALSYGYMLDLDGFTAVADAAAKFGFASPAAGESIDRLPANVPLFIARAGRDQLPGLLETLDRFIVHALKRNLPITFTNHASGPHAFDLYDASDASQVVIRQILLFLKTQLGACERSRRDC